jgi:NADH-quinone oxidoreductase subunit N
MNAIILSAIWGVVMMFAGVFIKNKSVPKYLAVTGLVCVLVFNILQEFNGLSLFNFPIQDMLRTDNFNLLFITLILGCTLVYFLLNATEIEKVGEHVGEYYALIFFILSGIAIVSTFNTLLMLFIGIEIISIPLYILTASDKRNLKSNEAALKYFLMGAFSTGIMLMGIAFLYGGTPNATFYIHLLQLGTGTLPVLVAVGLLLLLVSMSFKVSAAPFHFWTPDVYDGAPTVFTSFMSTMVKAAGFFAFLRLFTNAFGALQAQWQTLVLIITVATLVIGNITAVFQQSVKRMLSYSSIAQAGFMMLAIFAINTKAREGILLYSVAYSLATIGMFGVLTKMKDYTIDGFNGLAKTQPLMAFAATVCLLSLTGVPLTAGFQSKFFMLMAAVENGQHFWLVIVAVLLAAVSAYYYFKIIQAIYFKESETDSIVFEGTVTAPFKWMLLVIVALILMVGIYPEIIIGLLYA